MQLLRLIRVITVVIAVGIWLRFLATRMDLLARGAFGNANASFGRGYSSFISAEQIGVYVTAFAAVPLVLFAIPRFRWGVPTLSWCFLIMAAFPLSNVYRCFLSESNSFVGEIDWVGRRQPSFALSPLVLGFLLGYRIIAEELRTPKPSDTKTI